MAQGTRMLTTMMAKASLKELQEEVNAFTIHINPGDIIDIKFVTTVVGYAVMIMYKTTVTMPT